MSFSTYFVDRTFSLMFNITRALHGYLLYSYNITKHQENIHDGFPAPIYWALMYNNRALTDLYEIKSTITACVVGGTYFTKFKLTVNTLLSKGAILLF